MLLVSLADGGCGRVGVEVILLESERDTALRHVQNVPSGILFIGTQIGGIELAVAKRSQFELNGKQFVDGLGGLHLLYDGHHGLHSVLVSAHRVHGQLIQLAEFPLGSALGKVLFHQFSENGVDVFAVGFGQLVEAAVTGIGCRKGVLLHPTATGVTVKVLFRAYRLVEIGKVDARLQLALANRSDSH